MSKFCNVCGTQSDDNAELCQKCGNRFDTPQQAYYYQQPNGYQQPPYNNQQQPNGYQQPPFNNQQQPYGNQQYNSQQQNQNYSPTSVLDTVKTFGSSKLFLSIAIIFSILVLINLANFFTLPLSLENIDFPSFENSSDSFNFQIERLTDFVKYYIIIYMIPATIISIGLWQLFMSCKKGIKPVGMKTLKIGFGFMIGYFGLIMAGIIFIIIMVSQASEIMYTESFAILFILIFVLIAMALPIIYIAFFIKSIKSLAVTVETLQPLKLSAFVGVMSFISAGSTFLSSFSGSYNDIEPLELLSNLLTVAFNILLGILIFSYNKKMDEHINYQNYMQYRPY